MAGTVINGSRPPLIQTFVFLEMETTGFPTGQGEENLPDVTEIALVAVPRKSLTKASHDGDRPRIKDKLVLCVAPEKWVSRRAVALTGLTKGRLELCSKSRWDDAVVLSIRAFLLRQSAPICLVAHNGDPFDYPILRRELNAVRHPSMAIGGIELYTVDSLKFFPIYSGQKSNSLNSLSRRYFRKPSTHNAEEDATTLIGLISLRKFTLRFLRWVEKNKISFDI
ncbi:three-prime repair exonuclease 1-like [Ptychodera flava]|uniref:three-prime repair exonuclease 1-like n=1 Tax=Ptychodera flava TaxID=63121 RepID=UPI00396A937C